jgi:hypothetical protein
MLCRIQIWISCWRFQEYQIPLWNFLFSSFSSSSSLTEVDRDAKYDSLNFENQIKDHYANTPFFEGTIVLFLKSQLTKL